jgi:hypothetical protein
MVVPTADFRTTRAAAHRPQYWWLLQRFGRCRRRPAGLPAFFSKPAGLWGGYFLNASFTFSPASFRLDLA